MLHRQSRERLQTRRGYKLQLKSDLLSPLNSMFMQITNTIRLGYPRSWECHATRFRTKNCVDRAKNNISLAGRRGSVELNCVCRWFTRTRAPSARGCAIISGSTIQPAPCDPVLISAGVSDVLRHLPESFVSWTVHHWSMQDTGSPHPPPPTP